MLPALLAAQRGGARQAARHEEELKVVQQYVSRPLLLAGHKFHLRLWAVVTAVRPLRAYLHSRGLALFSGQRYDTAQMADAAGGLAACQVTNYARNANSRVLSLAQAAAELGPAAWGALLPKLRTSTARVLASALAPLHAAHAWLAPALHNYGFQMVGLDYLLDSDGHPWLLELNSSPSIMVVHSDPAMQSAIHDEKYSMLCDMISLVRHRVSRPAEGAGATSDGGSTAAPSATAAPVSGAKSWRDDYAAELANRRGFDPLMPYFPYDDDRLPWTADDRNLAALLNGQQPQQVAGNPTLRKDERRNQLP